MKTEILEEIFSIHNVGVSQREENPFLEIREKQQYCQVIEGKGVYKCLRVDTKYDENESGVLEKVAAVFSELGISIFAFTSIDYGYFFFREKLQNQVESSIINKI